MGITEQQAVLRQQLASNLRADSDAIQDHLKLLKFLTADGTPSTPLVLWTDTKPFSDAAVKINIDDGEDSPEARLLLCSALQLKVRTLLPQLCREVLDDAAKRAERALARFTDTAPAEETSTLGLILGTSLTAAPPHSTIDPNPEHPTSA
jgi:hypothetical protein